MKRSRLPSSPGLVRTTSTADLVRHPIAGLILEPKCRSSPPPLKAQRGEMPMDVEAAETETEATPAAAMAAASSWIITTDGGSIGLKKGILVVGAPIVDPISPSLVEAKSSEFLKACFRCKNGIKEGKAIFMFGYLKAFCSKKCRREQMKSESFKI